MRDLHAFPTIHFSFLMAVFAALVLAGCSESEEIINPTPTAVSLRFVDNGDGTVLDTQTGLIWLKDASCVDIPLTPGHGMANWDDANAGAALLADGTCGLTDGSSPGDWRLPSLSCPANNRCDIADAIGEFVDVLAPSCPAPFVLDAAGTGCWSEGDPFTGVRNAGMNDTYWSSTAVAGSQTAAWELRLRPDHRDVVWGSKNNVIYVWPVRDGP